VEPAVGVRAVDPFSTTDNFCRPRRSLQQDGPPQAIGRTSIASSARRALPSVETIVKGVKAYFTASCYDNHLDPRITLFGDDHELARGETIGIT
jgi:hypothetical protein